MKNNICLPYEKVIVFFDKKLFLKYKIDEENFAVDESFIKNDNKWILRYFISDNKEQVIVRLSDLRFIPLEEQQYLKSFNVLPNSDLPNKLLENVFLGEWVENDIIDSLKLLLKEFPSCTVDGEELKFWVEPNVDSIYKLESLNYVKTDTKVEWEHEIKTLHYNLIEGLNYKTIKKIATKLNCYEDKYKSVRLLKNCVVALRIIPTEEINMIFDPLFKLIDYRDKIISHAGISYPEENLNYNFEEILEKCYISYKFLTNIVKNGFFNFV